MPLNSAQLAALVERAKLRAAPVVAPPPTPPRRELSDKPPKPPPDASAPLPVPAVETASSDDFPIGWELRKESWHFHRRFYAIFRRPMARGEYSHLLWQIRRAKAEHLGEDCWRVTLPGGRILPVRARLITILPKNWQPPTPVAAASSASAEHAQEPGL
jgi:hypothetical protein